MSFLVLIQKRFEGQGVCWIVIEGEIRPILILCRYLKIIGRLCLPIVHGIIILAIARSSHRKFGFKKNAVQKENHDVQKNGSFSFLTNTNVWFLLLYALLNTTLHYAFFYFGLSHNAGARSAILNSMSVFTVVILA